MPFAHFEEQTNRRVWLSLLGVSGVVIGIFLALPRGDARMVFYDVIGFAIAGVMITRLLRSRADLATGWWLLSGGVLLSLLGDAAYNLHVFMEGHDPPIPWYTDIPFLASYLLFAAGTWQLTRVAHANTAYEALMDSAMVTLSVSALVWVGIISPALSDASLSHPGQVVTVAYPVLDLLWLGIAIRLLIAGINRKPSFYLLVTGIALFLVADFGFLYLSALDRYASNGALDLLWLLAYLALAAACWHPSATQAPPTAPPDADRPVSAWRLLALGALALIGPLVLIAQAVDDLNSQTVFVGVAAGLLALLAVLRVSGLSIRLNSALSRQEQMEEHLRQLALHDPLTTLPNRMLVATRLEEALSSPEANHHVAVLFVDLDRFKLINDTLGHATGDQLLKTVAERLSRHVGASDTVARFAGDEFVVLLNGIESAADAQATANRLLAAIISPISLSGQDLFIGASIGIAVGNPGEIDPNDLIRHADLALYRAKAAGRGKCVVFDPEMAAESSRRLSLESDLRKALEREELLLHYQPIVRLETEEITGAEALIRWEHPTRGMIPPGEFIDLAEETGLIVPLGYWVLETAGREAARWHRRNPDAHISISVNLSARQLRDPDLFDRLDRMLSTHQLPPHTLQIELTEQALIDDTSHIRERLLAIKSLGISIAIDDFGTGYSSLDYLSRLPVDALKIDASFVQALGTAPHASAILDAVIGLGRALDLVVTAEGIETAEQAERVLAAGCLYGQGYRYSAPVDAAIFQALIGLPPDPVPTHAESSRS